ncbi:MAG: Glycosyl transferase, group 1 [Parcubacteria group bacterium GW2011_GWA2_36_10]|nr:MAG: Glycosyl transferase, group 1 [Parcubacteria group bacterium GW2011_GWA2_36_10]
MNLIISQSLASGVPVITTKHSGLPEQVIEGYNGWLAPENDYNVLAEKILLAIKNRKQWKEFSINGRQHVLANYNSKILIEKQINYYRELINN